MAGSDVSEWWANGEQTEGKRRVNGEDIVVNERVYIPSNKTDRLLRTLIVLIVLAFVYNVAVIIYLVASECEEKEYAVYRHTDYIDKEMINPERHSLGYLNNTVSKSDLNEMVSAIRKTQVGRESNSMSFWVHDMYAGMGVVLPEYCCIGSMKDVGILGSNTENIPVGALVYSDTSIPIRVKCSCGANFSVVGIYLGDGEIAKAGGVVTVWTVDDWVKYYGFGGWNYGGAMLVNTDSI